MDMLESYVDYERKIDRTYAAQPDTIRRMYLSSANDLT
jgi:hypothetical protein